MADRTIEEILVKDVEKRKIPSKHYAYIIEVHWSDNTRSKIARQYSELFDFQMSLLEHFPVEGGQRDPSSRIIPFLPGKLLFRRSNTREVALKRMGPISDYCMGIAKMPKHVSHSEIVLNFFEPTQSDLSIPEITTGVSAENGSVNKSANKITGPLCLDKYVAIAEYKKNDRKQLNLKEGEVVGVIEKNENGWWLAANEEGANGWVPGVYLESLYGEKISPTKARAQSGQGERYAAICAYEASSQDELSFPVGCIVEVLEKNLEGWWFVSYEKEEGWVPAAYLERAGENETGIPQTSSTEDKKDGMTFRRLHQQSIGGTTRPPPKRSTVRRTLTKAAIARLQKDYTEKLKKQESVSDDEEFASTYMTLEDFTSTTNDGISFQKNQTVYVTQKSNAGWWYGRIGDQRGWVPQSYLKEYSENSSMKPSLGAKSDAVNSKCRLTPSFPSSPTWLSAEKSPSFLPSSPKKASKPQRPPAPVRTVAKQPGKTVERNDTSQSPSPTSRNVFPKKNMELIEFPWYKDVSRIEAEDALQTEREEGYFIIRPSERGARQGKPFSLTLFHQSTLWNFHIRKRPNDKKYAVGMYKELEPCFSSLPELVEYYKQNFMAIGENENKVKLIDSPSDIYNIC